MDGKKVTSFNKGKCVGETCNIRNETAEDTNFMCCEMKTYEFVTVKCPLYSYDITRILSCGCTECSYTKDIQISGFVRIVSVDDPTNYTIPNRTLEFYVGSTLYSTELDGSFREVIVTDGTRIVLQFRGGSDQDYIPNVETIILEDGKDDYDILVLLQSLPDPIYLDPSLEQLLMFGADGGMLPMINITIPANSMTLENGDALKRGDMVEAYLTFSDIRQENGLALTPGEFTTTDSEGFSQILETGGVAGINMFLQNTTKIVIIPGNIQLNLDTSQSQSGQSSWQLDQDAGNWEMPFAFEGQTGRRKKRQGTGGSITTSFPAQSVMKINIDKIDFDNRCFVRIFVYRDNECEADPGQATVCVFTKDFNGKNTVSKIVGYTDNTGAACISIPCNREHEILLNTELPYKTSDVHHLPSDFNFENIWNTRVKFRSPAISSTLVTSGDGPVHARSSSKSSTCQNGLAPDYHFTFILLDAPKPGKLFPTVDSPGLPNSWYPEPVTSPERVAVMVRVRVDVSTSKNHSIFFKPQHL